VVKKIFILLSLFLLQSSLAQKNLNEVLDSYEAYFELERYSTFIHTNKTTYLPGEKVWFAAYLFERKKSLPFEGTSMLTCSMFSAEGKVLQQASIKITDGSGSGYFDIPTDFTGNRVFLSAGSAWMDNFNEDDTYVTELTIAKSGQSNTVAGLIQEKGFDIGLMPEGGHLIEGVSNTIGFKIIDSNGMGFKPKSVKLVSADGGIIVNGINVNTYGIGRFDLIPLEEEKYRLEVELENGEIRSQTLENPRPYGITMSVNNLFRNKLTIAFKTNHKTLKHINGKDHFIAIHKDGQFTLTTFQLQETEETISIAKRDLFQGVNIITIFDPDINPILERLIYNPNETYRNTVEVETSHIQQDSTNLKIALKADKGLRAKLSISVLPEDTKAMYPKQNILSAFWIHPYIKGGLENASYYFGNYNRTKKYELDLLLLTQGWSRYDWKNVFGNPPKKEHALINGYSILGKISNAGNENTLTLYQKSNLDFYRSPIDNGQKFKIDNVNIFKDEELFFSLTDLNGKTKAPELEYEILPKTKDGSILWSDALFSRTTEFRPTVQTDSAVKNNPFLPDARTIALEEVTVSEEKIENKLVRNTGLSGALFTGFKVTEFETKMQPTVEDLLRGFGYRTAIHPITSQIIILPRNPLMGEPLIILDDIVMYNPSIRLDNLPPNFFRSQSSDFDEIYYTHNAVSMDNRPAIYLYRKYGGDSIDRFASFIAEEGFQRPQKFYNPKYTSYTTQDFTHLGTIHWESELLTSEEGEAQFTIPSLQQKNVALFIQGILNNGALISESRVIPIE